MMSSVKALVIYDTEAWKMNESQRIDGLGMDDLRRPTMKTQLERYKVIILETWN